MDAFLGYGNNLSKENFISSICKSLSLKYLQNSMPLKQHTVLQIFGSKRVTRQGPRLVCCLVRSSVPVTLFPDCIQITSRILLCKRNIINNIRKPSLLCPLIATGAKQGWFLYVPDS